MTPFKKEEFGRYCEFCSDGVVHTSRFDGHKYCDKCGFREPDSSTAIKKEKV